MSETASSSSSPAPGGDDTDEALEPRAKGGSARDYLFRRVPALDSLRTYSVQTFRADLLAGLTVAAVAVPQAMAYALIVGISPVYGLYSAIVTTAIGALFDSSKQLINGPTNAISIALLSALVIMPEEQRLSAAILMALLVGLIQIGITLLRLGDLSRYISHAVIVGFTAGAGLLLVLDQIKNLLGLPAQGGAHDHFMIRTGWTLARVDSFHYWTAVVGIGTVVLVLTTQTIKKRLGLVLVPEFLLAVIAMAALSNALDLDQHGVAVIGPIPARLPEFKLPTVDWRTVRDLSSEALTIALLGLLEAFAMAKAIAARTRQKLDINQQCLSEGLANVCGSFFQCMPGSGSLTRSAINQQAGGRTQWSGVMSAAAVAGIMLVFAPWARYIPRAALAGILMVSAWRMVDRQQVLYYVRATRFDAIIVWATALSAVCISVEFCIIIGTLLSFVLFIPRAAKLFATQLLVTPEGVLRARQPGEPCCNRILIYSLEGELFFGSAPDLEGHLEVIQQRVADETRVVVLSVLHARNPDATCLAILDQFLNRMADHKVTVLLGGVTKVLRRTGLTARFSPADRIFKEEGAAESSTMEAVRHAYEILGADVCAICPRRSDPNGGKGLPSRVS